MASINLKIGFVAAAHFSAPVFLSAVSMPYVSKSCEVEGYCLVSWITG